MHETNVFTVLSRVDMHTKCILGAQNARSVQLQSKNTDFYGLFGFFGSNW